MEARTPTKDLPNGYGRVPAVTINIFLDSGGATVAQAPPVEPPRPSPEPAIDDFLNGDPVEPEDDVDEIILRERFYALDIEAEHVVVALMDQPGRFTVNQIWAKLREYWDTEDHWTPETWAAGIKRSTGGMKLEPRFSSAEDAGRPIPKAIDPRGLRERLRKAINSAAILEHGKPVDVYQEPGGQGRETVYVVTALGDEEE